MSNLAPSTSATTVSPAPLRSADPFARVAGHGAAGICAILEFMAAYGAAKKGMQSVLVITLLTIGVLTVVLAVSSWTKRSRAAWSFLSVTSAVMALCIFFGSAQLRAALGISFTVCMIFPLLFVFTTAMLASLGRDYREGGFAQ